MVDWKEWFVALSIYNYCLYLETLKALGSHCVQYCQPSCSEELRGESKFSVEVRDYGSIVADPKEQTKDIEQYWPLLIGTLKSLIQLDLGDKDKEETKLHDYIARNYIKLWPMVYRHFFLFFCFFVFLFFFSWLLFVTNTCKRKQKNKTKQK